MAPGLVAVWIAIAQALAQDPGDSSGSLAATWSWREVSPARVRGEDFLAVSAVPGRPQRALAMDTQGGLWLSDDVGLSWSLVLSPMSALQDGTGGDSEDVLLAAESLAEDLFTERVTVVGEEEALEDPDLAQEAATEVINTLNTEAVGLDQLVSQASTSSEAGHSEMLWANPAREDELWAVRADGLWLSIDAGEHWRRQHDDLFPRCMAAPNDTTLIAGFTGAGDRQGLWRSADGGVSWTLIGGPLVGLAVYDLVRHPNSGRYLAASSGGLYRSDDGVTWTRAPGSPATATLALLADDGSEDGFWIATPERVLRTDNGGERLLGLSRYPLPNAVDLEPGLLPNELLYAGSDGVWESRDGGVSWKPVNSGMSTPEILDLVAVGGVWLAATGDGLRRLEPYVRTQDSQGQLWVPLSLPSTLDMAMTRPGLTPMDAGVVARSTALRRFMPELRLVGDYYQRRSLSADYTALTNESSMDRYWRVQAQLAWGSGNSSTAGDTSFDLGNSDIGVAGDDWFVLGDQVYGIEDIQAIPSAASNLSAEASAYRALLAQRITDLYVTRERLVSGRAQVQGADLHAQVMHELTIAEIEAMLDGYTDGAFTRPVNTPP